MYYVFFFVFFIFILTRPAGGAICKFALLEVDCV